MSTRYEFIALRRLNAIAQQSRKLHMTGPTTYPSKYMTSKPVVSRRDLESNNAVEKSSSANGRSFNTSRELKRNGDSSTMDFAYFPMAGASEHAGGMRMLRFDASADKAPVDVQMASVAKPEISTTSLGTPISPLSDVHDNTAVNIDFHTVTEQVTRAASKASEAISNEYNTLTSGVSAKASGGSLKSLWNGMVEDIVGSKRATMTKPSM